MNLIIPVALPTESSAFAKIGLSASSQLSVSQCTVNLVGDRGASKENDEQLAPEWRSLMLVCDNLRQQSVGFNLKIERGQQLCTGSIREASRNQRRYRVCAQFGTQDTVSCDAFGKSDEFVHFLLERFGKLVHPCRLSRGNRVGIKAPPEQGIDLERVP